MNLHLRFVLLTSPRAAFQRKTGTAILPHHRDARGKQGQLLLRRGRVQGSAGKPHAEMTHTGMKLLAEHVRLKFHLASPVRANGQASPAKRKDHSREHREAA